MIDVETIKTKGRRTCPKCFSPVLDESLGYMGSYSCRNCGYSWTAS